jgi:hypothetical protein
MAQAENSAIPSSGFLSAVVADGRAPMPRLRGVIAFDLDGPHELAIERQLAPPQHDRAAPRPARAASRAPATSATTDQQRGAPADVESPEPAGASDPMRAHPGFERVYDWAAATEYEAEIKCAKANIARPDTVPHRETVREGARPNQANGALEPVGLPMRPVAGAPEHSASETDSGTKMRERGMPQSALSGGERTPAPRARAAASLPHATQPENGNRPEAAPAAVHIGTLDIRIEAPKQRPAPPTRQPVRFRGSGILSRLYLRRD